MRRSPAPVSGFSSAAADRAPPSTFLQGACLPKSNTNSGILQGRCPPRFSHQPQALILRRFIRFSGHFRGLPPAISFPHDPFRLAAADFPQRPVPACSRPRLHVLFSPPSCNTLFAVIYCISPSVGSPAGPENVCNIKKGSL